MGHTILLYVCACVCAWCVYVCYVRVVALFHPPLCLVTCDLLSSSTYSLASSRRPGRTHGKNQSWGRFFVCLDAVVASQSCCNSSRVVYGGGVAHVTRSRCAFIQPLRYRRDGGNELILRGMRVVCMKGTLVMYIWLLVDRLVC